MPRLWLYWVSSITKCPLYRSLNVCRLPVNHPLIDRIRGFRRTNISNNTRLAFRKFFNCLLTHQLLVEFIVFAHALWFWIQAAFLRGPFCPQVIAAIECFRVNQVKALRQLFLEWFESIYCSLTTNSINGWENCRQHNNERVSLHLLIFVSVRQTLRSLSSRTVFDLVDAKVMGGLLHFLTRFTLLHVWLWLRTLFVYPWVLPFASLAKN